MNQFAFLLSVWVLLLAAIPCCLAEDCLKEKPATEQTKKEKDANPDTDCGLCSPFFRCHSCHNFAFTTSSTRVVLLILPESNSYPVYRPTFFNQFAASIWQPPKIA